MHQLPLGRGPQLAAARAASSIPGHPLQGAGLTQPHLAQGAAALLRLLPPLQFQGWILRPHGPALAIKPLMHQDPPLASSWRGRHPCGKRHPGRRRRVCGQCRDAAWLEGVAQARHRRRTPSARHHADGGQPWHEQKQHQGQGQGRDHHPHAAPQQHPPVSPGSHLQGQQAGQGHHHHRPLQQAAGQIGLQRRLQPGAQQLQQTDQSPFLQLPGLPQFQAAEQGEQDRQAAQQIDGPQPQQTHPQQSEGQPLQPS